jgi:hypothetical protein
MEKNSIKKNYLKLLLLYFPIILFIFFPESSLQTSLHLKKESCHTIYLCKTIFGLGVADWMIVLMATILIFHTTYKKEFFNISKRCVFYKVIFVYFFYFLLGIVYNFFIEFHLISFLYDFKLLLYFAVTYYWLKIFIKLNWTSNHFAYILLLLAFGTYWDAIYINNFGVNERPKYLPFIPSTLEAVPSALIIPFIFLFKKFRLIFIIIFIFDFLNNISSTSLGNLFGIITTIFMMCLYQNHFSKRLIFFLVFFGYLFVSTALPLIIEAYPSFLFGNKTTGVEIRQIKTLIFWDNFFMNIPGIIGKGFGSTYYETIIHPLTNVYSTGIYHQDGNVKFVWHTPLGKYYKLGLVGNFILLIILISASVRLFKSSKFKYDNFSKYIAVTYGTVIISAFVSIGQIKWFILASIVLYITDQKLSPLSK